MAKIENNVYVYQVVAVVVVEHYKSSVIGHSD